MESEGAADEAVLNIVNKKKNSPPLLLAVFLSCSVGITLSSLSQAGFVQEQQVLCQTWRGRGRRRRQMKQCWIKYIHKKKIPLFYIIPLVPGWICPRTASPLSNRAAAAAVEVREGEGAVAAFLWAEPPPAASLAGWLPPAELPGLKPAELPGLMKPYIFDITHVISEFFYKIFFSSVIAVKLLGLDSTKYFYLLFFVEAVPVGTYC